ncbi:hypothetical protein ACOSQ3_006654 [Xanthoceras sorbifolium]
MEWMEMDLLWNIGGMLGSMCKVDPIIKSQTRGRFARIYVEIDMSKPLRGTLLIDGRRVRVEYESMRLICFNCGRIGHGRKSCHEGLQANQNEGSRMETEINSPLQPEGNRYDRTGIGGRNGRLENIGDLGPVKSKYGDTEILDKHSGGMKKDKVGFKYTGTSLNNASRAGGFRFDILNYLAENNCEEGVIQKSKGVDLKQKEVLTEVTNLKEKIRVNKKFDKSKVSSTVRDGYYSQKKSGTASSKAKKQLMHNTSSGNEKQPLRAGIFEDIIHDDRVDNSQS